MQICNVFEKLHCKTFNSKKRHKTIRSAVLLHLIMKDPVQETLISHVDALLVPQSLRCQRIKSTHDKHGCRMCIDLSLKKKHGDLVFPSLDAPEAPQNLSCQTNLTTDTLTCIWDAGQLETHLLTTYSLHTKIW